MHPWRPEGPNKGRGGRRGQSREGGSAERIVTSQGALVPPSARRRGSFSPCRGVSSACTHEAREAAGALRVALCHAAPAPGLALSLLRPAPASPGRQALSAQTRQEPARPRRQGALPRRCQALSPPTSCHIPRMPDTPWDGWRRPCWQMHCAQRQVALTASSQGGEAPEGRAGRAVEQ